jgi:hypothetical protein
MESIYTPKADMTLEEATTPKPNAYFEHMDCLGVVLRSSVYALKTSDQNSDAQACNTKKLYIKLSYILIRSFFYHLLQSQSKISKSLV